MPAPSRYEIEIRGRVTSRVLRPVVDDFTIDATRAGTTRLVGEIRDPSHLHGLLAHFSSLNVEILTLRRLDEEAAPSLPDPPPPSSPPAQKGNQP